jgi:hypothetical protein
MLALMILVFLLFAWAITGTVGFGIAAGAFVALVFVLAVLDS